MHADGGRRTRGSFLASCLGVGVLLVAFRVRVRRLLERQAAVIVNPVGCRLASNKVLCKRGVIPFFCKPVKGNWARLWSDTGQCEQKSSTKSVPNYSSFNVFSIKFNHSSYSKIYAKYHKFLRLT